MKLLFIFIVTFTYTPILYPMNQPNEHRRQVSTLNTRNICSFTPICRPNSNTGEVIIAKITGTHPSSTYLYLTYSDEEDHLLENSSDTYLFSRCSAKGTYLAALSVNYPQVTPHRVIPNPANTVKVWNLNTKKLALTFLTQQLQFAISPQENYIACDAEDNASLVVYSLVTSKIHAQFTKQKPKAYFGVCPAMQDSISFSPNDQFIAYEECGIIRVLDLQYPKQPSIVIERGGYSPQFENNNLLKIRRPGGILDSILLSAYQKQQNTSGD